MKSMKIETLINLILFIEIEGGMKMKSVLWAGKEKEDC